MARGNWRQAPTLIVPDGQSLNILPGGTNSFGYKCCLGLTKTACLQGVTVSIGGTSWQELDQTKTRRCFIHALSAPLTILLMNGGTSDFSPNNDSGATYYTRVKNYASAAKTAGFNKVVICTTTSTTGMSAGQNTNRKAGNDLVIGNADGVFDAVVDLASDSSLSNPGGSHSGTTWYGSGHLSDPTNSTYYNDGVHWNGTGSGDAGASVQPALIALGAS